ncbi:myelin regulatory factor-like isoform X2 [Aphidius gifuensis]|uniref:myelin regulatory factor-like isoform X2 n=1 Tax=Aphidius gifuensis TaxID=684658 RepID=UPI001CDD082E|nr:myelin regulatory factor-like isoform X2 [Aphidius gifuensis]
MDVIGDGDEQTFQAILGRSDFVGGIDNEALDFSQLEDFINSDNPQAATYFADTLAHNETTGTSNHNVRIDSSGTQQQQSQQPPRIPSPMSNVTNSNHHVPGNGTTTVTSVNNYKEQQQQQQQQQSYVHPHALPESPPDSGSEPPYSPPGHHESQTIHSPHQKAAGLQDILIHHQNNTNGFVPTSLIPTSPRQLSSSADTLLLTHPVLTPLLTASTTSLSTQQQQQQQPPPPPPPPPLPSLPSLGSTLPQQPILVTIPHEQSPSGITTIYSSLQSAPKKRKLSQDNSGIVHVKQEPELGTIEHSCSSSSAVLDNDDVNGDNSYIDSTYQCIRFHPFQQTSWHALCDHNLKELPNPHYRVDADKGFNFSNSDDAFVCQKKNHFQITCHAQLQGDAVFVRTGEGLKKISSFQLHFYGVKVESPTQTIRVEQSQSDRSKKPFHPVVVELGGERVTKVTVGRLHFSETTSNNMRKKGKPNPDQRYFHLVVGLHAHTADQLSYQVVAHASERIIVRASNPGQFESEGTGVGNEGGWQRGAAPDSVYHAGRVGINTDRPDEALVVHGNMKVTGHIVQPSDARAKQNVQEVDTKEQLRNVQQLRVVRYQYDPEFALHSGLDMKIHGDTGVIAQEVQQILPEAVLPAGDIILPNGQLIENFLVVNKERIFMENVGAVKELCKVTDNLETRIDQLERINKRLNKIKRDDSLKSTISTISNCSANKYTNSSTSKNSLSTKKIINQDDDLLCSNKFIQIVIVILILIMAFCLVAMATLYFLEYQKRNNFEWTKIVGSHASNSGHHGSGGHANSNNMLAIGPSLPTTASSSPPSSSSNYHSKYNDLSGSTLPTYLTKQGIFTREMESNADNIDTSGNSRILNHDIGHTTTTPNNKQQLYSQEITYYPFGNSGVQKTDKNNEYPNNWLSKNGGIVPSNVDENDQNDNIDGNNKLQPIGRPINCQRHFSDIENSCQIYCCSSDIRQLEEPHPEHPPVKKIIPDHLEQSIGIHEEKRKSIKGIQNGINPSDQNTQTLVKEANFKYPHKRNRRETGGSDWGEFASNAAGSLPPEPKPQLQIIAKTFNVTLDHRYCTMTPINSQNNFTCDIPLSKYMPDKHLSLHFIGMPWSWQIVQLCPIEINSPIDETMTCDWGGYNLHQQQSKLAGNNNQPGDQSFVLDVAFYMRKNIKFRVPTVQPQENVCENRHGGDYLEFTLNFHRDCDG